jgi:hypothetical protein
MAATTPGEFRFVRGCFIVAAILMVASALMLHSLEGVALWVRAATAALIGAVALGGLTVALDWVRHKEMAIQKPVETSGEQPKIQTPPITPQIDLTKNEGVLIPGNAPMPELARRCGLPENALAVFIGSNLAWSTPSSHRFGDG